MNRRSLIALGAVVLVSALTHGQSCSIQTYFTFPGETEAARDIIRQAIDGAQSTLEIALASFTDDWLGDAVVLAQERGLDIRVILDGRLKDASASEYEKLLGAGVPVRLSDVSGAFGHRFAIIDRRIVLTGSYEWIDQEISGPFDSLTRITCATPAQAVTAQAFLAEFDRLWANWEQVPSIASYAASTLSSISILTVDRSLQCIDLLNSSDRPVDLSQWSLNDLEGQYVFPEGTEISPNDPYRICIDTFNPAGDPDGLYFAEEADELFLTTPEGDIIDEVVW